MNRIVSYYVIMSSGDANYFTVKIHMRIKQNAGALYSVITDIISQIDSTVAYYLHPSTPTS